LRYRAASFFGRLYASEILMGMRTEDEEREIVQTESEVIESKPATKAAASLVNEKIKAKKAVKQETIKEEIINDEPSSDPVTEPENSSGEHESSPHF
jgi:hypothetical protein